MARAMSGGSGFVLLRVEPFIPEPQHVRFGRSFGGKKTAPEDSWVVAVLSVLGGVWVWRGDGSGRRSSRQMRWDGGLSGARGLDKCGGRLGVGMLQYEENLRLAIF